MCSVDLNPNVLTTSIDHFQRYCSGKKYSLLNKHCPVVGHVVTMKKLNNSFFQQNFNSTEDIMKFMKQ